MKSIRQTVSDFGMSLMKWGSQSGFSGSGSGAASFYFKRLFGDAFEGGECNISDNSIVSICYQFTASKFVEARPTVQVRREGAGRAEWVDDEKNPLAQVTWNPSYSLSNLFASTVVDLMRGNALWIAGRSGTGKIVEWWWMPWQFVQVVPRTDSVGLPFGYRVSVGSISQVFLPEDVIHFRGFRLNPNNTLLGLDPLPPQIPHIRVDNACAKYVETILPNLGVPGALFTQKGTNARMSDESVIELKRRYKANTTGDKRFEPIVIDAPYEVTFPEVNPDDMALEVIGDTAEERIPAAFQLNAVALNLGAGLARSTYNNVESAQRNAFDNGVAPYHRIIAEALTDFGVREYGFDKQRVRFWFDYSDIPALQEDKNELHKRVRADFVSGGIDRMTFKQKLGYEADEAEDKGVYVKQAAPGGLGPEPPAEQRAAPVETRAAPELKAPTPDSILPAFDEDVVLDAIARATPDMQRLMLARQAPEETESEDA